MIDLSLRQMMMPWEFDDLGSPHSSGRRNLPRHYLLEIYHRKKRKNRDDHRPQRLTPPTMPSHLHDHHPLPRHHRVNHLISQQLIVPPRHGRGAIRVVIVTSANMQVIIKHRPPEQSRTNLPETSLKQQNQAQNLR
jgi:hypothetical protein